MTTTNSQANLERRLGQATEQILEIKSQVVKTLGHHAESVGALVKKHPLIAIGIGLGTGYLIARLVHR